ncbi:helix-hairpin-helix domain-containing protein [Rhizobacter sp. LjRoot28]|jgi:hypothetical protein|uniref:helix-hairpin-helix domain-containing protein n=1 Tax=Rhizobacter sp. LjRoot28 TaxID=3342309 RepID=UPI003ECDC889
MAAIKAPKAHSPDHCERLEQLPNIGPALADALRRLGIQHPRELRGKDAYALYRELCQVTGHRQDPCVLDTFMAATDFMAGAAPAPWWAYTARRKAAFGSL